MNGIHKIGSDGGGTVALTVPITSTNATATLQAQDGVVALTDNIRGFKNYIINGNFDVWQRGTSFAPASGSTYTADRWIAYGNGAMTFVMTQTVTSNKYLHINYVNGQICAVGQRLECNADTIANFSNNKFTMSFKTRFNVLPTQAISWGVLLSHTSGMTTLVQGSISYVYGSQTVSVTFTIPDLSGYTLDSSSFIEFRPFFNFATENVPTQSVGLYQVQLEEGSIATPFEQRPYGLELSLCQRYYEIGVSQPFTGQTNVYDTNPLMGVSIFCVNKRVTPTMTSIGINSLVFFRAYTTMAVYKTNGNDSNGSAWSASAEL